MTGPRPAVFNIASGTPFVDALAIGLMQRHGGGPLSLSRVTVLLPTRRACRSLREAFLRVTAGAPLLLPALRPLGDVDEEELALNGGDALEVPPAISALRRQLLLTRMIRRRAGFEHPAQAALLAAELAQLLDQVQTERVDFAALHGLVPAEFAGHWQATLEFLKIVTAQWPAVLREEGLLDPAARRNLLLAAQAERWQQSPANGPIYAAGSTGSIPATAELLKVIARLPQGAVVLPGLDQDLDDASWQALDDEPTHPQFGLKQLLHRLQVDRAEVEPWPAPGVAGAHPDRLALLRQALKPAATSDGWAVAPAPDPEALRGIVRIDAPGPQEEAGMIALLLREVLETPGRTAALVTPDRDLARRVASELARWGIDIDDSAGQPLAQTPPGAFLRLTAALIAEQAAPVPLLAALKHPLAAGGIARDRFRRRVRALERAVLRGPRPAAGVAGLVAALTAERGKHRELVAWLEEIARQAAPFAALMRQSTAPLVDLLSCHVAFAEWLAGDDGGPQLWAGEAGEAAADFIAELRLAAADLEPLPGATWPALLDVLLAGKVLRPRYGRHPRLAVWGPLEARLQQADLLILGGLNEGTWPTDAGADPWLSRPMRRTFGLAPPERRIGLAAHDFQQAAAAGNVILTRAEKVEGTPTVPSRWLLRLERFLAGRGLALESRPATDLARWQALLDRPAQIRPVAAPLPRPPLAARPRQLSVTRIEIWIRDPYAIYARYILGLKPLDPLDADPGAAERGNIIHRALDRFIGAYPEALPPDAAARLLAIGREEFAATMGRPGVRAFWWPRFERIADWFIDFEHRRRSAGTRPLASECRGRLDIAGPAGTFRLTATADRIDRLADGGLAIIDYKTGQPPSQRQVEIGLVPQLPLEAVIAAAGGFADVPAAGVAELAHLQLRGGAVAGEFKPLKADVGVLAATALDGLQRLIAAYDQLETPYQSRLIPKFLDRPGDFDHLARVAEWSAGGGGEE